MSVVDIAVFRCFERVPSLSSIYQDVPLYSLDEFKKLAPEEARAEHVLSDEHQLMLNRLSFELAERQRFTRFHNHMLSYLIYMPFT